MEDFKKVKMKGYRKPLFFPIWDTKYTVLDDKTVEIEFTAPKGCFATAVLREIMKLDVV